MVPATPRLVAAQAVENGLYALFASDPELAGLAPGGVFRDAGDQDATTPYVVYQHERGTRQYVLGGNAGGYRPVSFQIKAVDQSEDAGAAFAVKQRVTELLESGQLVVEGYRVINVMEVEDIEYDERGESNQVWQHVGSHWEVTVQ